MKIVEKVLFIPICCVCDQVRDDQQTSIARDAWSIWGLIKRSLNRGSLFRKRSGGGSSA